MILIYQTEQYEAARESALRSLTARACSVQELAQKLLAKDFPEQVVRAVTARFIEVGLLDDLEYARTLVRVGFNERHHGVHRIQTDLQRRGVPAEIIDQVVGEYREHLEENAATQAATKAIRRYRNVESSVMQRKLYAALRRRGFGHELTLKAVARVIEGHSDSEPV